MTFLPQSLPYTRRKRIGVRAVRLPFHISWTTLALFGIVILAAVLRFANIGAIGQATTYYTAAVESMLQSWHNFFFVAAEPGGSVSIDKPPVGLWLQAISAYFLGVNGFAVVLPQMLTGIASVIVLFHLVRRSFGNIAGLIASFALAVTPVAIAVERNNTPDATLILCLLLAAWGFIKATETRKLRFLLLGALMIGIWLQYQDDAGPAAVASDVCVVSVRLAATMVAQDRPSLCHNTGADTDCFIVGDNC